MGCSTSKDDDTPAVALCRERCASLDEAVRLRFTFSQAHAAYFLSLKAVGVSLDNFFNLDVEGPGGSPVLNLPPQRKGDPHPHRTSGSSSDAVHHIHSHSDSGSHLDFHSNSEDEDDSGSEFLHDHEVSSPAHRQNPYGGGGGYVPAYGNFSFPVASGGGGGGFVNVRYMKNQAAPSTIHTLRPMSSETMYMGESSASYYPYPGYHNNRNHGPNPPYSNYNYDGYPNYSGYSAGGGFSYGSSSAPAPYGREFSPAPQVASSYEPSRPPPSPPRSSGWDFLNPFESFEKYYPTITPNRDFKAVREEEGIPDLEDEDDDDEDEVVKEVHGNQKFVDRGRSSHAKPRVLEEDVRVASDTQVTRDPVEYEVRSVDKKVVDGEDRSKKSANVSGFKTSGGFKGDLDIMRAIQIQFDRASESGAELSQFLEVGKLPYKRRKGVHQVSSKILHFPLISSQPSTSNGSEADSTDPAYLDAGQDLEMKSRKLSSTLHKLYLWEKKLYEEVKIEEKSRILHERKSRKLEHLDERGAESSKIDTTRKLVRDLSTKIRIAIQVVDKISVKINCLRDEELWPQLHVFIQGLTTMWKHMLECHQIQCQAIAEAKRLDAIAFHKHFTDAHFEATRQLGHDLINWTSQFSHWVGAQKGYIRALNNWLMKCLLYVPEETADGTVPFSPSRVGAPPVFIVCNQWCQSIDRISEKEVVNSMRGLVSNVVHLWDRDKAEMRQKMLAHKDERNIKNLDKEDQKIKKGVLALDKRMVVLNSAYDNAMPLTGHAVFQSETTKGGSLQASLQHVLEAMERFTASTVKVYEELLQRIQEDNLAGQNESVS